MLPDSLERESIDMSTADQPGAAVEGDLSPGSLVKFGKETRLSDEAMLELAQQKVKCVADIQ